MNFDSLHSHASSLRVNDGWLSLFSFRFILNMLCMIFFSPGPVCLSLGFLCYMFSLGCSDLVVSTSSTHLFRGRRSWGWRGPDPLKICRRGRSTFWPPKNVIFFHSKLLLDNSASFTSSRMKDLYQKWKAKLISRGAWNSSMAWPDWSWLVWKNGR